MSRALTEVDRELLGETLYSSEAEAVTAKANAGTGHGVQKDSDGTGFTPINAAAGTLVKMSSNGDEVDARKANKDTNIVKTEPTGTNIVETEPTPKTPKKRATPKKKSAVDANVKPEDDETIGQTEAPAPVTPKKAKRAPAKAKATKTDDAKTSDESVSPVKGNGEIEGMTVNNTPRKRQAPKKDLAVPRGIPSSWENADYADRMMVSMKEKGEVWAEIRVMWKDVTGQETAASTLPNRYNRIKMNMMHMKEGDHQHLLAAKKEVEDAHTSGFWTNVAATMERRGAGQYSTAFLQKTFKELEAAGKTALNPVNGTKQGDAITVKHEDAEDDNDDDDEDDDA